MKGFLSFSVFGLLACLTVTNPFWGCINYIYMYHVNPSRLSNMFPGVSFITIIMILFIISFVMNPTKLSSIRVRHYYQLILSVAILLLCFLCSFFALENKEVALNDSIEFSKILLSAYFILKVISNEKQLNIFLTFLTVLITYVAFMRYFGKPLGLIGSPSQIVTMAGLEIAIHSELAIFIAVSFVFFYQRKSLKEKAFFFCLLVFQINFMFVGYRRTPILALGLIVFFFILTGKPSKIIRNIIVCVLLIGVITILADKKAIQRSNSTFNRIETNEKIDSRFYIWEGAAITISEYPLGIGLGNFFYHSKYVVDPDFSAGTLHGKKVNGIVTHNTYLQVLTELGVVGLLLYLGIIFFTWITLRKMRKKYHSLPEGIDNRIYLWAWGLEIGLLALCGDMAFRNRFDFEPFWWVVVLSAILSHFDKQRLSNNELSEEVFLYEQ